MLSTEPNAGDEYADNLLHSLCKNSPLDSTQAAICPLILLPSILLLARQTSFLHHQAPIHHLPFILHPSTVQHPFLPISSNQTALYVCMSQALP